MKSKNILSIILLLVSLLLVACSSNNISTDSDSSLRQIRIGATTVPHSEILEFIKPTLKDQGIDLQITTFSEYTQINQSTSAGDLDANFFQHIPYLDSYVRESGQKLVAVGPVHIEPMGIYSNAIKSMDELPDGATVAYPNDATNGNRAFLLLINNGYIKLKDGATIQVTEDDIAENPKNLKFIPLAAEILPRVLNDSTISMINTNYAMEAGLNPTTDSLLMEDSKSLYANNLVVREGDENNEDIQTLYRALTSEEVRQFILDKYNGAIVPAF